MVSVSKPIQSVQNGGNDVLQKSGQIGARQDAADGLRNTSTDSKALDAMKRENKLSDEHSAKLQQIQGEANRNIQSQNVASAINSAQQDASNKSISSAAQNAKGISY